MSNIITAQSNHHFPRYQSHNRENQSEHYRCQQSLSASTSMGANRFARIPPKMPYQQHPMTQITITLIQALPTIRNP